MARYVSSLSERVQVFHERGDGTVESAHLGVGRLDQVVLIRGMRTGPVSESEMTGGQAKRRIGEDVSGPGARRARPQLRIEAELAIGRQLGLDEPAGGIGLGWVVAAAHVDFDVAEAVFGEMGLELGEG